MSYQVGDVQIGTTEALLGGSNNVLRILRSNGWNLGALRTNATLPKNAWIAIDSTVQEVAGQRLNAIADLQSRGFTRDLGGLGILYDYWQNASDGLTARQDMDGTSTGDENKLDFGETGVPIPITHCDFRIPIRQLAAMERQGTPLDTTMVAQATRKVVEKLEDTLVNGSTVVSGGNSLYGYMTYTNSNALTSLTGNWTGTPANIEKDACKLIASLEDDRHYGPYILYVHANEWNDLRQRDSTAGGISYLQILKDMAGIEDVKPLGVMSANDVILVEMSRETVDLDVGVDIQVVEWPTHGGMQMNFKVMAAMAPRIKADYAGRCGVVYDTDIGSS